jgi:hypothetical protein
MFGSAKPLASPTTFAVSGTATRSHANTTREDLAALFAHLKYSDPDLLRSFTDECRNALQALRDP